MLQQPCYIFQISLKAIVIVKNDDNIFNNPSEIDKRINQLT